MWLSNLAALAAKQGDYAAARICKLTEMSGQHFGQKLPRRTGRSDPMLCFTIDRRACSQEIEAAALPRPCRTPQ